MPIVAISSLLYVACFGLYQAHPKRATIGFAQASDANRRLLRWSAWSLFALTLIILGGRQGYEIAIPTWLGLLCLVGAANLLISALWPKRHVASGIAFGAAAVLTGAAAFIGGL